MNEFASGVLMTLNGPLFTQDWVRSDALTSKCCIVHEMAEEGLFDVVVFRNGEIRGRVSLVVARSVTESIASIDLATIGDLRSGLGGGVPANRSLKPGGRLILSVSDGAGGYSARVSDATGKGITYDSATLGAGDLFGAFLIRPGSYRMSNVETGAAGMIEVDYPDPKQIWPRPGGFPVTVRVTQEGFEPSAIRISAGQGIIFKLETEASIRAEWTQGARSEPAERRPLRLNEATQMVLNLLKARRACKDKE